MTDILERLTDYIAKCPSAIGRTFHEMDEEVLIAQSADEIVKLRAALRKIADEKNWTEWLGWNGEEEPQDIARAALGEKEGD